MAYAESTIGGTYGGSFRVFVNSIRSYDGSAAENYENWYCNGGVNRVSTSGGHIYHYDNTCTYTIQLGINGMATSGNWSYDTTGTGNILSRNTGTTTAYRNSAGVGFGFTSRTDANMDNSPYVTSGWVQSSDSVQTKYRHASLTALSMDSGGIPATDEGPMWVEFSNPSGAAVDAFLELPDGSNRVFTSPSGISSRYNYPWSAALQAKFEQATPNSNSFTVRIGIHDSLGGDNYDYRDRTYTIKNDTGQANPTFTDFDYLDTNATTVAVTGDNSVLVQNLSTLQVNIPAAKAAIANKYANLGTYNITIGGYSGSVTWPATGDVSQNVGTISDVSGTQSLAVHATDARGNATTVSKSVTVLPYFDPGFYGGLKVEYANGFDATDGLATILFNGVTIGSAAPMTLNGVNKNVPSTTSGLKFDLSKGDDTSYTGTWVNVATTNQSNGYVNVDAGTLSNAILSKMSAIGEDNTVRWYVKFSITDAFSTQYYETIIDIGRPIFRIGNDGLLYHNEVEFHEEFNPSNVIYLSGLSAEAGAGTFSYEGWSGVSFGPGDLLNTSAALNDYIYFPVYLNKGTYYCTASYIMGAEQGIVSHSISGGQFGNGSFQYSKDCYATAYAESLYTLNNMVIQAPGVYNFIFQVTGKNASATAYTLRVLGLRFVRTA